MELRFLPAEFLIRRSQPCRSVRDRDLQSIPRPSHPDHEDGKEQKTRLYRVRERLLVTPSTMKPGINDESKTATIPGFVPAYQNVAAVADNANAANE